VKGMMKDWFRLGMGLAAALAVAARAEGAATLLTVDVLGNSYSAGPEIAGLFQDYNHQFDDIVINYSPSAASFSFDSVGQTQTFTLGEMVVQGGNIYDFVPALGLNDVDVRVNDTSPFMRFFSYNGGTFEMNLDTDAEMTMSSSTDAALFTTAGGEARGATGPRFSRPNGFAFLDAGTASVLYKFGGSGQAVVAYDVKPVLIDSRAQRLSLEGTATLVSYTPIPEPGLLFGFGGLVFLWIANRVRRAYFTTSVA